MSECETYIKEIRLVMEDELTQCYVLIDTNGDCPNNVEGWHHKTFAASENALIILKSIAFQDYLEWPVDSP